MKNDKQEYVYIIFTHDRFDANFRSQMKITEIFYRKY